MEDVKFMKMAIKEALKGVGRTSPNPIVGAVIVCDGKLVGKGYHQKAGSPHAEINALRDAGSRADGATIYVTLEPCNHHGRTPPCTKAIIKSGIKRVVVGMIDPNPNVSGGGNNYLSNYGIDVLSGILEEECTRINRPFVKHTRFGTPWISLKAGLSLDGKIAAHNGQSSWITCKKSRQYVHKLRNQFDGILVGVDTVENDDPSLTTRLAKGESRDPVRIILDTNLRMSAKAKMLLQESKADTLIYCGDKVNSEKQEALTAAGAHVLPITVGDDGHVDLKMVMSDLGRRNITSVLVEGGSKIHASFIKNRLADQAFLFFAPIFIGADGISITAPLHIDNVKKASRLHQIHTKKFGDDVMIEGIF